jgi:hypothetical protein
MASRKPKRTRGSQRREILEPKEFISDMSERRKNIALWLVVSLDVLFMLLVILQALNFTHLSQRIIYAIVASLLATNAYVIRAAFK